MHLSNRICGRVGRNQVHGHVIVKNYLHVNSTNTHLKSLWGESFWPEACFVSEPHWEWGHCRMKAGHLPLQKAFIVRILWCCFNSTDAFSGFSPADCEVWFEWGQMVRLLGQDVCWLIDMGVDHPKKNQTHNGSNQAMRKHEVKSPG